MLEILILLCTLVGILMLILVAMGLLCVIGFGLWCFLVGVQITIVNLCRRWFK